MQTETAKSKKGNWLIAALILVAAGWLVANWQDFKDGFISGYSAHTDSKP